MQDIGEKVKNIMKKKTNDDQPIGSLKRVSDFLPPPNELISEIEKKKITLVLDNDVISIFKNLADKNGTKYQKMMREVLKGYAKKYGT